MSRRNPLQFGSLELFGILRDGELIDYILDVSVHKCLKIVYGIIYTVIGDTPLRVVLGTYLSRTVAGRHHGLSAGSYIVDIFLVFFIVDEGA